MDYANKTFLTSIDEFESNKWAYDISDGIDSIKDHLGHWTQNYFFLILPVIGEPLGYKGFEVCNRLPTEDADVVVQDNTVSMKLEGKKLDLGRYSAVYSRRYKCCLGKWGHFDLLVPRETGMLYASHELRSNRPFIQWAVHEHDNEAQEIMENANYALLQNSRSAFVNRDPLPAGAPQFPLVALIYDKNMLIMGETLTASTGYCIPNDVRAN